MSWDGPGLFDSVEQTGVWWSPEHHRDRVAGTASFDPEEGVCLRTIGAFGWASAGAVGGAPVRPPILLGLTEFMPTPVTLYRAARIGPVDLSPQPTASTYGARCMIVGFHFHDPADVLFSSLSASFTDLEEWVGHHPFAGTIPGSHTRYRPPDPSEVEVDSLGARIRVEHSVSNRSDGLRLMRWDHVALLTVEPREPKPFNWYEEVLRSLQDLLTLLVGRPAYPRAAKAKPPGYNAEFELFFHQGLRSPRDQGLASRHGLSREGDVLVAMRQVSPGLQTVVGNWFERRDRLRPVHELFFGSLFAPRTYPEFQFLSLAQALETYHRRTSPGRPTLKKRLEHLFGELPASGIVEDRPNLVQKVLDTRNFLTHYPDNLEDRALGGTELLEVIEDLRRMLLFFLLRELGLDVRMIITAVAKIPRSIYYSSDD